MEEKKNPSAKAASGPLVIYLLSRIFSDIVTDTDEMRARAWDRGYGESETVFT